MENVTIECFENVNIDIRPGVSCKIIASSDYDKQVFIDTILAVRKPLSGNVFLFDINIFESPPLLTAETFKRIGVIPNNGGLISNLKVWENIALPIWYHHNISPESVEGKVVDLILEMGMLKDNLYDIMGKLPGPLPISYKKIISIVRSMLMDPDLMIYDSLLEGLDPWFAKKIANSTKKFHKQKEGRNSLYISSVEESLKMIETDLIIRQEEKGFKLCQ